MTDLIENVRSAVYSALTGDAVLMAIVTGVHASIPQKEAFPYVRLDFEAATWADKIQNGEDVDLTLGVWASGPAAVGTCHNVINECKRVLRAGLSVPVGTNLVLTRYVDQRVFEEQDDIYHGVLRWRFLIE